MINWHGWKQLQSSTFLVKYRLEGTWLSSGVLHMTLIGSRRLSERRHHAGEAEHATSLPESRRLGVQLLAGPSLDPDVE